MAATHKDGVAWYGSYHGQLNYFGGISCVHETWERKELSEWLTNHPGGVLIFRLTGTSLAAVQDLGIDEANSIPLTAAQMEQITQILRADETFPGRDWQPKVTHVYWIRRGLPVAPYVFVQFFNPPGSCPAF